MFIFPVLRSDFQVGASMSGVGPMSGANSVFKGLLLAEEIFLRSFSDWHITSIDGKPILI